MTYPERHLHAEPEIWRKNKHFDISHQDKKPTKPFDASEISRQSQIGLPIILKLGSVLDMGGSNLQGQIQSR